MSSGEEKPRWSVFDGVKTISVAPESLVAEINSAIAALEYARAAAAAFSSVSKTKSANKSRSSQYDARMADEAYKSGLASIAAGKVDEAVMSLNVALSKCPPDKTAAIAKLRSLISLTSQRLQKSSN